MRRILRAVKRPLVGHQTAEELEERVEVVEHIVEGLQGRVGRLEQELDPASDSDEKREY